jgi:acyl dehydratase
MTTLDQADRLILDFYRCAMLPLSQGAGPNDADHADDLSKVGADLAPPPSAVDEWDGDVFRERIPGPHFDTDLAGTVLQSSADVVSSAPELARLTLNIAAVHHDSRIGGRRLVYGGHTIGLALAQASRLLPNLATVLGWRSCDHTAPVYEGDTLYSELHIDSAESTDNGGVLGLRSLVYAVSDTHDDPPRQVLDWRFTALQF